MACRLDGLGERFGRHIIAPDADDLAVAADQEQRRQAASRLQKIKDSGLLIADF